MREDEKPPSLGPTITKSLKSHVTVLVLPTGHSTLFSNLSWNSFTKCNKGCVWQLKTQEMGLRGERSQWTKWQKKSTGTEVERWEDCSIDMVYISNNNKQHAMAALTRWGEKKQRENSFPPCTGRVFPELQLHQHSPTSSHEGTHKP